MPLSMIRLKKRSNLSFRFPSVDLCPPLLVGVLPHKKEKGSSEEKKEVFLCVKQQLVLEVDVQSGRERNRMELDSLTRVETNEAQWTHGVKRKKIYIQFSLLSLK